MAGPFKKELLFFAASLSGVADPDLVFLTGSVLGKRSDQDLYSKKKMGSPAVLGKRADPGLVRIFRFKTPLESC